MIDYFSARCQFALLLSLFFILYCTFNRDYLKDNPGILNYKTMDGFQCPICIETLESPIRMLPCGHNYCEPCLENLPSPSSQIRCNKQRSCNFYSILYKIEFY